MFVKLFKCFSDWQGGKTIGNIQRIGDTFFIRHRGDKLAQFSCKNFSGSTEKAFSEAQRFLYSYWKQNDLLVNKYRSVEGGNGVYYEVWVGESSIFYVDAEDLKLVNSYYWRLRTPYNSVYAQAGGQKLFFHRALFDLQDPRKKVSHRDGNALNNRKSNL